LKTDLYSFDGWVKTWHDSEDNVIRVKWFNYTSRVHVRKSCEAQLEAMVKYNTTVIVADASEATGHPYPQDQEWFVKNLYPKSLELGLRVIISVLPKNIIARSGAQTWNNTAKNSGLNYIEVYTTEEAERALNDFYAQLNRK